MSIDRRPSASDLSAYLFIARTGGEIGIPTGSAVARLYGPTTLFLSTLYVLQARLSPVIPIRGIGLPESHLTKT
jgi:hypothetical protein